MKIAIAGFMHESNTLAPGRTAEADFGLPPALLCGPLGERVNQGGYSRACHGSGSWHTGAAIFEAWSEAHHEMGGFIEACGRLGFDLVPTLMAWATPGPPVADAVLDRAVETMLDGIRRAGVVDGLLLALHGAMVAESYADGDGEVLGRLREALGPRFPIVNTFDFHGNASEQQVAASTAMLYYQTNPHVDQRQRGIAAAELLARIVHGEVDPVMALAKPPMILPIVHQNTSAEPLRSILAEARRSEESGAADPQRRLGAGPDAGVRERRRGAILAANVVAGFPYADVPQMGPAVVTVADGDVEPARREADRLAGLLWSARNQMAINLPDAGRAVAEAVASDRQPVVLVDFGDNIGGGSPGDGTVLLAELLQQQAEGWVVVLCDPPSVARCCRAGVGQPVELTVGGKSDRLHGDPVAVGGVVRLIHEGKWVEPLARHGGKRHNDQGLTAVVQVGPCGGATTEVARGRPAGARCALPQPPAGAANLLVLNSLRTPPFSLGQLTSLGIVPEEQRILVVKAAIAYRAAYEPIAHRIIEVDTPGITAVNPARLRYRRIRRPIWPLHHGADGANGSESR